MDESLQKDYMSQLIQANMIESRNPAKTFELIENCISILNKNPEILSQSKAEHHKQILQQRLEYLRVYLTTWSPEKVRRIPQEAVTPTEEPTPTTKQPVPGSPPLSCSRVWSRDGPTYCSATDYLPSNAWEDRCSG